MSTNVTLRMDEELLRQIRHRAVDDGLSLSAWITMTVRRLVETNATAEAARDRALRRLDRGYSLGGRPLTREQMHAR